MPKEFNIKEISKIGSIIKKKIIIDIKKISQKKKIKGLKLSHKPLLMGVLNLTPDSFSDGGKFNKKNFGEIHAKKLFRDGCNILDIGGEATNPGSKEVDIDNEWKRIFPTLLKLKKKGNLFH